MLPVKKWVERSFTFGIPLHMAPVLAERLRGAAPHIDEIAHSVPANLLTQRVESHWSVQEQIGHLLVLEELWRGRLDDFDHGLEMLRPADMKNMKTEESNFNSWELEKLLRAFRREREEFVAGIERMTEAEIARTSLHPRLKQSITIVDSMFFVAEHDDHHIAKMREVLHWIQANP